MKPMGRKIRHVHFVGIGGIGMSGIISITLISVPMEPTV